LVSVGYAAEERRHPGRRPVEHNVFHQRYGAPVTLSGSRNSAVGVDLRI